MMYQSRGELIPSLVEMMLLWQLKEPRHWREHILNRWSRRNKNYAVGNAVMDTGSCYFHGKDPISCQHVKNNALLERITTPGCIPITFLSYFRCCVLVYRLLTWFSINYVFQYMYCITLWLFVGSYLCICMQFLWHR